MTTHSNINFIWNPLALVAIAACLIAAGGTSARADIIHVYDGESIQAAIDGCSSGDEIIVHPGTYYECIDCLGKALYLHSSDGANQTTIDGAGFGLSVVTCAVGETSSTILEGFTITGGTGTYLPALDVFRGGGMYNLGSSPTVNDCIFTGNAVLGGGGGMCNENAHPAISSCTFTANHAAVPGVTGGGGGMLNTDGSHPTVVDCVFEDNTGRDGGGMVNRIGSDGSISTCSFVNNTAEFHGGGMSNVSSDPAINDCTFTGNNATHGGALYAIQSGLSILNCVFDSNEVADTNVEFTGTGGAISLVESSSSIIGCSFVANSATDVPPATNDSALGGAISATDCIGLNIDDCTFTGNAAAGIIGASGDGGAICLEAGTTTITNCSFTTNSAIYNAAVVSWNGGASTISDCNFSQNTASIKIGAVRVLDGQAVITRCSFVDNEAVTNEGGALGFHASALSEVRDCVFTGNAAGDYGGAMGVWAGSTPLIIGCTFSNNTAGVGGGAMDIYTTVAPSEPKIIDCVFEGNAAAYGAAVHVQDTGMPEFLNCRFNGNSAGSLGGALRVVQAQPLLTNCTVSDNTASAGGGIHNSAGHPVISNSILWGDEGGELVNEMGGVPTITYSDVQGGWSGEGNIDEDPLFVDPANGDYHLSAGSHCIDAGDCTAVPPGIVTDLDGNPRFVDDPVTPDTGIGYPCVDMGAYEFQVIPPCPADINGDSIVDVQDLLALLAAWGNTSGPEDINGDGIVDVQDLLELLAAWGPC